MREKEHSTMSCVSVGLSVPFIVMVVGLVRKRSCHDGFRDKKRGKRESSADKSSSGKRTTPGIPTWSPTVVLTGPDDA